MLEHWNKYNIYTTDTATPPVRLQEKLKPGFTDGLELTFLFVIYHKNGTNLYLTSLQYSA